MQPNTVKHLVAYHRSWKRRALRMLLRKKNRRRFFGNAYLREFFFQKVKENSLLPAKPLSALVDFSEQVVLKNFSSRNGNLSAYEVLVIATLVAHKKPLNVLEIGTFDGNTTLQMALNISKMGKIHTIDLPKDQLQTHQPILDSDLAFIQDEVKHCRKFEGTTLEKKIIQHFGDSTAYDFNRFNGPHDFVFIDGGHSYECVASDTENALKHLSEKGWILWHDFTPLFGGVYQFLNELAKDYPLIHIEETNLALYASA